MNILDILEYGRNQLIMLVLQKNNACNIEWAGSRA